jgi:signal transduction histidine kinase
VSHELKTPLAIIKGESELALRRVKSPEEYRRVLNSNLEEIERMVKTVDDLLLMTRLDYQSNVLKFQELNLIDFINEMKDPIKILTEPKDIKVNYHLPSGMIEINADPAHLRRLIYNIVHNAVKFTPKNGNIDMTVKRSGSVATIAIKDSGPGIPPDVLPRIFDQFFHYDGSPGMPKASGTGLGLNIAQSIAKLHKGQISVESKVGRGAEFIIELPTCSFFKSLLKA